MVEFFVEVLGWIGSLFYNAYYAEESNPQAQRLTLGCGLVVFIVVCAAGVWFLLRYAAAENLS